MRAWAWKALRFLVALVLPLPPPLLLVPPHEPDLRDSPELPEVRDDAELRDEPPLVRLAHVRQEDVRFRPLHEDAELVRQAEVHVEDRSDLVLLRIRPPRDGDLVLG